MVVPAPPRGFSAPLGSAAVGYTDAVSSEDSATQKAKMQSMDMPVHPKSAEALKIIDAVR